MNERDFDRLLRGATPPAPARDLAARILAAVRVEPPVPWWADLWPFGAPARSPLHPLAGMAAAVLIGAICGTALTQALTTAAAEEFAATEIRVEEAVVVAFFPEVAFIDEGPR